MKLCQGMGIRPVLLPQTTEFKEVDLGVNINLDAGTKRSVEKQTVEK